MNIAACKRKCVVLLTHVNSTITKEEVLPNNFIFSIHIKHHLFCLLILTTNLTLPPLSREIPPCLSISFIFFVIFFLYKIVHFVWKCKEIK